LNIELNHDGSLIATSGMDMKIQLRNANNGKFIIDIHCEESKKPIKKKKRRDDTKMDEDNEGDGDENAMEEEEDDEDEDLNSVECTSFCKTMPLIAAATLKGQLFVWDRNVYQMRAQCENLNSDGEAIGFCKLIWVNEVIYAATLDGNVLVYDGRNLQLLNKFSGHRAEILDVCLNDTSNCLYTSSDDHTIKMFQL
jgi:WD40 repeat protein